MRQLLLKGGLWLAYALFAGISAWMTATALQLNWFPVEKSLQLFMFIIMFVVAFIVGLFAGYCLDLAIKEFKNHINPNKLKFVVCLFGFLFFWSISFMTNVHYMIIGQHGVANLSGQLADVDEFLVRNSAEKKDSIENKRDAEIKAFEDELDQQTIVFCNRMKGVINDNIVGLGPNAKDDLKRIKSIFDRYAKRYNDTYDYGEIIYPKQGDKRLESITDRIGINQIVIPHFVDQETKNGTIDQAKKKMLETIQKAYKVKIEYTEKNDSLRGIAQKLNKKLAEISKDKKGGYTNCYNFFTEMNDELITKVNGYKETIGKYEKDGNGENTFVGYRIYPSERMFDVLSVWEDWFSGDLPGNISLARQFTLSIAFDAIAFILICIIL